MSDIHALSGAYAVDALDDVERAGFERHLATCPTCRDEVASLEEAASLLIESASPLSAPDTLRERVMAEIALFRPLPPLTGQAAPAPVVRGDHGHAAPEARDLAPVVPLRRRRVPALAAAAAVVAALGLGATVVQPLVDRGRDGQPVITESGVQRVLQAPDARTQTYTIKGGARAVVTVSRELGQAVLRAEGLGDLPPGMVYELWLQHDERMVAAGFLPAGADATVLLTGDASTATAIGITTEPEGGSPQPSLDTAIRFPLTKV
ncbi:anti-sigma factor [Nocardioides sp. TRM66260-LWL]|uniref:anti-sigma factor n=1 Tax=Nocardioides sp. TRM66260-LWL TaxID=2874478 RepID=UPI001CC82E5A|nr:anti-sigma factor [Nocardioides sp. TRM66260-LWL]MBZ5736000.1 anti-sigma factor [Nocardioides sp. TRM66260-LWL]